MKDFQGMLINQDITLKQAMANMDKFRISTLFVVNYQKKLVGCVTDGDVRRSILKKVPLNEKVANFMNPNPTKIFSHELVSKETIKERMTQKEIRHLPIIDSADKIVNVISYLDLIEKSFSDLLSNPVVIMAGGEGTRLRPLTGILPKPLAPVGSKAIIQRIIENFQSYGLKNFHISVNYMAEMVKTYFSYIDHGCQINFINEDELAGKKLGTIGGLAYLKDQLNETFFVSNCDILIDANYTAILNFHKNSENQVTVVGALKNTKVPYGVLNLKEEGTVESIHEKPEYDHLINTGMYVLEPEVLQYIPRDKKYDTTDLLTDLIKRGIKVGVFPIRSNQWFDIGQWEKYEEVLGHLENDEFRFKQG